MKITHPHRTLASRWLGMTVLWTTLTACGALSAQAADGEGRPPKPPAEALAACKSLSSGQQCSFAAPQGTVEGLCMAPQGKPLACRPKDAAGGHPPPPQRPAAQ